LYFQIEVHRTLNPTDDELLEPFWKESGPFVDDTDPNLDNVAFENDGGQNTESDDASSRKGDPQCAKTSDLPSVSSHRHSAKPAGRPPPTSYDYVINIIKQELKGVEERLRSEMLEHFNRVEKKIDLFIQTVGRGGVQSERSGFDYGAYSTHSRGNEGARMEEEEVIIEDCSKEEVTPKKQHEAFPTYDDGIFSLFLFAIS
jgi:hypothetical protein